MLAIYRSESDSEKTKEIQNLKKRLEQSEQKIGQLTLERYWLGKNLTKFSDQMDPTEIVSPNSELSISRQCELSGINRASYYREQSQKQEGDYSHGESDENLEIMKEIDKLKFNLA